MKYSSDHLISKKAQIVSFIKEQYKDFLPLVNPLHFEANVELYIYRDLIECLFNDDGSIRAIGLARPVGNESDLFDTTIFADNSNLIALDFLYAQHKDDFAKLLKALKLKFPEVENIIYYRKLKSNLTPKIVSLERAYKLINIFGDK